MTFSNQVNPSEHFLNYLTINSSRLTSQSEQLYLKINLLFKSSLPPPNIHQEIMNLSEDQDGYICLIKLIENSLLNYKDIQTVYYYIINLLLYKVRKSHERFEIDCHKYLFYNLIKIIEDIPMLIGSKTIKIFYSHILRLFSAVALRYNELLTLFFQFLHHIYPHNQELSTKNFEDIYTLNYYHLIYILNNFYDEFHMTRRNNKENINENDEEEEEDDGTGGGGDISPYDPKSQCSFLDYNTINLIEKKLLNEFVYLMLIVNNNLNDFKTNYNNNVVNIQKEQQKFIQNQIYQMSFSSIVFPSSSSNNSSSSNSSIFYQEILSFLISSYDNNIIYFLYLNFIKNYLNLSSINLLALKNNYNNLYLFIINFLRSDFFHFFLFSSLSNEDSNNNNNSIKFSKKNQEESLTYVYKYFDILKILLKIHEYPLSKEILEIKLDFFVLLHDFSSSYLLKLNEIYSLLSVSALFSEYYNPALIAKNKRLKSNKLINFTRELLLLLMNVTSSQFQYPIDLAINSNYIAQLSNILQIILNILILNPRSYLILSYNFFFNLEEILLDNDNSNILTYFQQQNIFHNLFLIITIHLNYTPNLLTLAALGFNKDIEPTENFSLGDGLPLIPETLVYNQQGQPIDCDGKLLTNDDLALLYSDELLDEEEYDDFVQLRDEKFGLKEMVEFTFDLINLDFLIILKNNINYFLMSPIENWSLLENTMTILSYGMSNIKKLIEKGYSGSKLSSSSVININNSKDKLLFLNNNININGNSKLDLINELIYYLLKIGTISIIFCQQFFTNIQNILTSSNYLYSNKNYSTQGVLGVPKNPSKWNQASIYSILYTTTTKYLGSLTFLLTNSSYFYLQFNDENELNSSFIYQNSNVMTYSTLNLLKYSLFFTLNSSFRPEFLPKEFEEEELSCMFHNEVDTVNKENDNDFIQFISRHYISANSFYKLSIKSNTLIKSNNFSNESISELQTHFPSFINQQYQQKFNEIFSDFILNHHQNSNSKIDTLFKNNQFLIYLILIFISSYKPTNCNCKTILLLVESFVRLIISSVSSNFLLLSDEEKSYHKLLISNLLFLLSLPVQHYLNEFLQCMQMNFIESNDLDSSSINVKLIPLSSHGMLQDSLQYLYSYLIYLSQLIRFAEDSELIKTTNDNENNMKDYDKHFLLPLINKVNFYIEKIFIIIQKILLSSFQNNLPYSINYLLIKVINKIYEINLRFLTNLKQYSEDYLLEPFYFTLFNTFAFSFSSSSISSPLMNSLTISSLNITSGLLEYIQTQHNKYSSPEYLNQLKQEKYEEYLINLLYTINNSIYNYLISLTSSSSSISNSELLINLPSNLKINYDIINEFFKLVYFYGLKARKILEIITKKTNFLIEFYEIITIILRVTIEKEILTSLIQCFNILFSPPSSTLLNNASLSLNKTVDLQNLLILKSFQTPSNQLTLLPSIFLLIPASSFSSSIFSSCYLYSYYKLFIYLLTSNKLPINLVTLVIQASLSILQALIHFTDQSKDTPNDYLELSRLLHSLFIEEYVLSSSSNIEKSKDLLALPLTYFSNEHRLYLVQLLQHYVHYSPRKYKLILNDMYKITQGDSSPDTILSYNLN